MGVFRNLGLVGKRMMKQPLSREDIYSYCAGFIKTPPMVEQCKDFYTISVKHDGKLIAMTEYYRSRILIPTLDKIANAVTWQLQRKVCIEAMLEDVYWGNLYYCTENTRTDLGKEFILQKLETVFPDSNRDERMRTVFSFFMMNLSAGVAIQVLGSAYFGIEKQKTAEIDLYRSFQRDFMMFDARIMDYIGENHLDQSEAGYLIADWRDELVCKVTQKMSNLLTTMKDQIANDNFDFPRFKQMSDIIEKDRENLAQELASIILAVGGVGDAGRHHE